MKQIHHLCETTIEIRIWKKNLTKHSLLVRITSRKSYLRKPHFYPVVCKGSNISLSNTRRQQSFFQLNESDDCKHNDTFH